LLYSYVHYVFIAGSYYQVQRRYCCNVIYCTVYVCFCKMINNTGGSMTWFGAFDYFAKIPFLHEQHKIQKAARSKTQHYDAMRVASCVIVSIAAAIPDKSNV